MTSLDPVKGVASRISGRLFGAACALWGRARRPRALGEAAGEGRVLVLAPHPDDEVAGCGGTIALHGRAGDEVTVLVAGDGRRSRALDLPPPEVAELRRGECRLASERLGVRRLEQLGLPEGDWSIGQLMPHLDRLLVELCPGIVYAPSLLDGHPEHLRLAMALSRVLEARLAERSPLVRVYEVQIPLTPLLTNLVFDVSPVRDVLVSALAAHASQRGSLDRTLRARAITARLHAVSRGRAEEPPLAEPFWGMSARAYVKLHGDRAEVSGLAGLRARPLLDPVAYLTGHADRRRLRACAERGEGPWSG